MTAELDDEGGGRPLPHASGDVLGRFYSDALFALGEHARKGGTALGAAVVVKRVAREHGVDVESVPLPRLTRAERDDLRFAAYERGGR